MIEINNLTSFAVDKKFFTGVAKIVLKGENKEKKNLSVVFVGKEEIKKINKKYRNKNHPTDVLSFGQILSFNPITSVRIFEKDLGEVIICPEVVKENTKKYFSSPASGFKKEIAKVLIHGILHLLGYDHEKTKKEEIKMEKKEEYYLCRFFL
jgi:probable rRNA maturation factor